MARHFCVVLAKGTNGTTGQANVLPYGTDVKGHAGSRRLIVTEAPFLTGGIVTGDGKWRTGKLTLNIELKEGASPECTDQSSDWQNGTYPKNLIHEKADDLINTFLTNSRDQWAGTEFDRLRYLALLKAPSGSNIYMRVWYWDYLKDYAITIVTRSGQRIGNLRLDLLCTTKPQMQGINDI